MTSKQAGYQSSHNAAVDLQDTIDSHHAASNVAFDLQGTVGAMANITTTITSDGATVAHLSKTKASLNAKLDQYSTQLTTART
jgi:hypothetical protein